MNETKTTKRYVDDNLLGKAFFSVPALDSEWDFPTRKFLLM